MGGLRRSSKIRQAKVFLALLMFGGPMSYGQSNPLSPASYFQADNSVFTASDLGAFSLWNSYEEDHLRLDAAGSVYRLGPAAVVGSCRIEQPDVCGRTVALREWTLQRQVPGGAPEVLGRFADACVDQKFYGFGNVMLKGVDVVNGYLYVVVEFWRTSGCDQQVWLRDYFVKVAGPPALLDVVLSYQPPATLSWNVPAKPFALPGANAFSVYTGSLTTVSDLAMAIPLVCEVPAGRAPIPGEVLTAADSLPDPTAGDGRYYLATAIYQGQTRAGRSNIAGQLHGRMATRLSGCTMQ
jgi:hypothetical protein